MIQGNLSSFELTEKQFQNLKTICVNCVRQKIQEFLQQIVTGKLIHYTITLNS